MKQILTVHTVPPATDILEDDRIFVGDSSGETPETNHLTIAQIEDDLGEFGVVFDYDPTLYQVTTPTPIEVLPQGAEWDGHVLSAAAAGNITNIGTAAEPRQIEYVAIKSPDLSLGKFKVSGITDDTSFMLVALSPQVTLDTYLSNFSKMESNYPFSCVMAYGVSGGLLAGYNRNLGAIAPTTQTALLPAVAGVTDFEIRTVDYVQYLIELGLDPSTIPPEELAMSRLFNLHILTIPNPDGSIPNGRQFTTFAAKELTDVYFVLCSNLNSVFGGDYTAPPLLGSSVGINLDELSNTTYTLPPEARDGDVLKVLTPAKIFGYDVNVGDYLNLYAGGTKAVINRQQDFFDQFIVTPSAPPLSEDRVRGLLYLGEFSSLAEAPTTAISGQRISVPREDSTLDNPNFSWYFWNDGTGGWFEFLDQPRREQTGTNFDFSWISVDSKEKMLADGGQTFLSNRENTGESVYSPVPLKGMNGEYIGFLPAPLWQLAGCDNFKISITDVVVPVTGGGVWHNLYTIFLTSEIITGTTFQRPQQGVEINVMRNTLDEGLNADQIQVTSWELTGSGNKILLDSPYFELIDRGLGRLGNLVISLDKKGPSRNFNVSFKMLGSGLAPQQVSLLAPPSRQIGTNIYITNLTGYKGFISSIDMGFFKYGKLGV